MTVPDHHIAPHAPAPAPRPGTRLAWRKVGRLLAPRATRAQIMAFLLCVLLGFAFVTQVRSNQGEGLATLSQEELVRILAKTLDVPRRNVQIVRGETSQKKLIAVDLAAGLDAEALLSRLTPSQ